MSVSADNGSIYPGQNAVYSINVTAQGGIADDVTVQISLPAGQTTSGLSAPVFNLCNRGSGTAVCSFGNMRENQSIGAQAEVSVPSKSAGGGTVILAATAKAVAPGASTQGAVNESATVNVNKTSTGGGHSGGGSGSGGGSKHHHSGSGGHNGSGGNGNSGSGSNGGGNTTGDSQPFDTLPPLLGSGGSGTGSTSGSGSSSNLFPTINPSSGSGGSGNSDALSAKATHKPYKATTVADVLPLNSGQLSAQVAGLVVLFLGILLVFARITLRRPRSPQPKE